MAGVRVSTGVRVVDRQVMAGRCSHTHSSYKAIKEDKLYLCVQVEARLIRLQISMFL